MNINFPMVLKQGASREKLDDLGNFQKSRLFTKKGKVALEYAEAITYSDCKATDELFHMLKGHYTDDKIVELTAVISFQNLSSKFNSAFDIAPQGFCDLPSKNLTTK